MNFDDFFDKSDSRPSGSGSRDFDKSFITPLDPEPIKRPSAASAFFAGIFALVLLSVAEGTLVWIILDSLEDLGVLDRRLDWHPFIVIAFAVNILRALERGVRSGFKGK